MARWDVGCGNCARERTARGAASNEFRRRHGVGFADLGAIGIPSLPLRTEEVA